VFRHVVPLARDASAGLRRRDLLHVALSQPRLAWAAAVRLWHRNQSMRRAVRHAPALAQPAKAARHDIDFAYFSQILAARLPTIELAQSATGLSLGVRDIDLPAAVDLLSAACPSGQWHIEHDTTPLAAKGRAARIIRAGCVRFSWPAIGGPQQHIRLEGYARHGADKWVSANPSNTTLRAIYTDPFERPRLIRACDILGGEPLEAIAARRPVDVVYTWVNHLDRNWQALYQQALRSSRGSGQKSADCDHLARFRNNDELRFSLRALAANLPWVRKIYILTNCAPPPWLRLGDSRLVWLRHEDVIPATMLPSFNSHVIESYLHHIEGLSEHFLYFNDDFFVTRPREKTDFFTEAGLSLSRLENYGMVSGEVTVGAADYLNAARNAARLIHAAFGFLPTRLHQHLPYALQKSVLAEMEQAFAPHFEAFRTNRFRQSNDLSLPSFFFHHYAIATRRAVVDAQPAVLIKPADIRWRAQLAHARSGDTAYLCLNEGGAHEPGRHWSRQIGAFLAEKFAQKSPWEG